MSVKSCPVCLAVLALVERIKFTIERTDKSNNQSIPFLDTSITLYEDGTYSTELYVYKANGSTHHHALHIGSSYAV